MCRVAYSPPLCSTFTDENAKDGDLYIRSVCFSPDGKYLAAGAEDKTVKVWDIEKKTIKYTFVGHELDIYSLDFSSDGRFIVSGSGDKKAKVWSMESGKVLLLLPLALPHPPPAPRFNPC